MSGSAAIRFKKAHHGGVGVEHALVHIDVDHLRAVFHLLAGHVQRGGVVAIQDQLGKGAAAGDVGALADVHKQVFVANH